jgi:hypothetical protein
VITKRSLGSLRCTPVFYGPSLAADGAGHLVASGTLMGPTDFGKGQRTIAGASDPWLASLDPATGATSWDKVMTTSADDGTGTVAIDGAGNIALAVSLPAAPSPTTIDGFPMPTTPGMYLAKLGSNGTLKWLRHFPATAPVKITGGDFAAAANGDVAMSGGYQGGSVDLGGGPLPDPGSSIYGGFFLGLGDPPP